MKLSLSELAAVLQHFFSEKTPEKRARSKVRRARGLGRARFLPRIFGISGVFACETPADSGNFRKF